MCQVGFRVLRDTKAGRRNERGAGLHKQALVEGKSDMKDRIIRFLATLSAVAAMAIAGGASFKGF
jgi:hypothetical protein